MRFSQDLSHGQTRRQTCAGGSTGGGQRLEVVFDLEVEVQPRSESWTNKKTNMRRLSNR